MHRHPKKHFLLRSILTCVLLTALFSSVFLAGSVWLYATRGIDASLDLDLLKENQGRTTKLFCLDGNGEETELADQRLYGTENRIWISLSDIPRDVQNAFIAIEDHRFFEHSGVDVRRTAGALLSFVSPSVGSYGGSTITQQLVKNLTGDNSVTVKRKLTEIMRALRLEKEISKNDILELYLNTVYLSEGCYGIETAAEKYFSKQASSLTLAEGAALAAILQYPTRYDPIQNPAGNRERRDTVLWRMHELSMIDDATYEAAVSSDTVLHVREPKKTEGKNSWFTEVVIEDVIQDLTKKYDISRTVASHMIYGGGLSIYTTMDARLQRQAEQFYANPDNFPKNTVGARATSAAVVIDPKTGYLLAVAGDTGEKRSDRIFNLATQMLRSPGSVIKPVSVYAPAIESGLCTWASVIDDVPVTFTEKGTGFTMWPKNNPRVYAGLTTVNAALSKSTNTVAVRLLQKVGIEESFAFCRSVGLVSLIDHEKARDGSILSDKSVAPLALGATTRGTSVREMTGAYTMLADGGIYHSPISYTKVYDKDGNLLLSHEEEGVRVISPETADIMTKMLCNVVSSGTAKSLTLHKTVPVAGKTGTSNADTDRWFIGYTPSLLCGVWYGYKDARDIGKFASNPAVSVFDSLVTRLYANGADTVSLDKTLAFATSDNVISSLYCKDSGDAPAAACRHDPRGHRVELGYFKKGTEPKSTCDTHILVDYDSETHAVASPHCPPEHLTKTALVKVYDRAFPCPVTITDAEYVYRHLPFGASSSAERSRAFFQDAYEKGCFIGSSATDHAYNRACHEHELPPAKIESPLETTAPQGPSETTVENLGGSAADGTSASPPEVTKPRKRLGR